MIVKVCGVRSAAIAEVALDAGADWLGIVLEPRSPRHVDRAAARAVAGAARGRATLVAVMVSPTMAQCEAAADDLEVDAIQVHGTLDPELALLCPVPVIPALNAVSAATVFAEQWWPACLLLVDGAPEDARALPGGTGRMANTAAVAALARHRPVMLAGGLAPGNVAAAVEAVRPRGVDASSGLESSPGVKDPALVVAYVGAARAAAAALPQSSPW